MGIQGFLKFCEVDPTNLPFVMGQYYEFKAQYPDFIMLFRAGEFFETYFEDAIEFAYCCSIAMTRKKIRQGNIPMAGIPHKKLDIYIEKLIKNDYKVVVVDQTNERDENGYYIRKVTKTYTKGCILELEFLNPKENNYLASLYKNNNICYFCYTDVSTGEIYTTEGELLEIKCELARICPKEFLLPKDIDIKEDFIGMQRIEFLDPDFYTGSGENPAHSAILNYMKFILGEYTPEFEIIKKYDIKKNLLIDFDTRKNLELTKNSYDNKKTGSLVWALDNCKTPMGKRLLDYIVSTPLCDLDEIVKRQNLFNKFLRNADFAQKLPLLLENTGDILRLTSRMSNETITPLEFLTLKNGLQILKEIEVINNNLNLQLINKTYDSRILTDFYETLEKIIEDDIEKVKSGEYIKFGASSDFDLLTMEHEEISREIADYESGLRTYFGIKSLKIVKRPIGYAIEIPNSEVKNIGDDFRIIQKLKSSVRYTSDKLISLEERIFAQKTRIEETKKSLFEDLKKRAKKLTSNVRNYSKTLAMLDVLQSFYASTMEYKLICPSVNAGGNFDIKNGRHITAERILNSYDPLDIKFKNSDFIMLTGKNGIGKSTLLKEIGTIVVLAQAGFFVPADMTELPLIDRLFAVLTVTDELIKKKSMHQVQMHEVSRAIKNSTKNSLILFDEIGKNTSYQDGLSIFCGVAKYLARNNTAKTITTTHFLHAKKFIEDVEEKISFLEITDNSGKRQVKSGIAKYSKGIEAAEAEDLPAEIINDAKKILEIVMS